jgi:hypothetical protein
MTDMHDLEDESFDVVVDKAAMDALLVGEGDVWNPDPHSRCVGAEHVSAHFSNLGTGWRSSFAHFLCPTAFSKKYLLGWHPARQQQPEGHWSRDARTRAR